MKKRSINELYKITKKIIPQLSSFSYTLSSDDGVLAAYPAIILVKNNL